MTRAWQSRWIAFWFEPSTPTDLGVCRLLFYAFLAWVASHSDLRGWAEVSDVFWMPVPLFAWLGIGVLPAELLGLVQAAWRTALVLSAVGLWTRFSTGAAFVLGLYCLGLPHNFGKVHHLDAVVVLTLGVLAVSRCGDAWSLDACLRRRRVAPPAANGEYTWPVRLVQALLALTFFAAGVAKLRHAGLAWALSDNMAMVFMQANAPLGLALAQYGWLCRLIAAGTIAAEVGAPLALLGTRARWLLMPALFAMQVGIFVVMRVRFHTFMVCYLFWVPWKSLGRWLRDRLQGFAVAWRMREVSHGA